jgi:hypothetical protein
MSLGDPQEPISYAVTLAAANELKAKVEASKVVGHHGEAGRARENILREFLASFCPRGFGLETGFVFDANARVSRQQDIIIYRRSSHPIFNVGGVQYFPIESVAAVLEVKSGLNSRKALNDALNCIASVKELDRTGKGLNYIIAGDTQRALDLNRHEHQVFSAVIMMGGLTDSNALDVVAQWCRDHDRKQWPNNVASAFDYSIYYETPGDMPRSNTMAAEAICMTSLEDNVGGTMPILDSLGQLISFLRVTPYVDFRPYNYFPKLNGMGICISFPNTTSPRGEHEVLG